MIIYLDTSAALKLVIAEPESQAVAEYLMFVRREGHSVVSSMLLFTQIHCAANRRLTSPAPDTVNGVLMSVELIDIERTDLTLAAAMPGRLRSADAIHLAVALRVGADKIVAYDSELLIAATTAGLMVAAPT